MLTNINIANEFGVFSAVVDANYNTAENLFFAGGTFSGSAVLNQGGIIGTIDSFAGIGSIAYNVANNQIFFANGSSFSFAQGGQTISLTSIGDTSGFLGFNDTGLSYTPSVGDGSLAISVTENGETVSAVLNVVGTVTYNIDGSISLGSGTIVQNNFADGDILTIAANSDAFGSITLNETGLNVTSTTPEAVNITLKTPGTAALAFTSIIGTLNYNNDTVTIADGTIVNIAGSDYGNYNGYFAVTGGTASARYTAAGDIYTVSNGATFTCNLTWNNENVILELKRGTLIDVYANETRDSMEVLTAGTSVNFNNGEIPFLLANAGSYTLNGINITTTVDNIPVLLPAYDTIMVNGLPYSSLGGNFGLIIGENGVLVTSADLAGDFLPNYDNDFNNALLLTDAGTNMFDTQQLTDLLPSDTTSLGEISFDTQIDKLSKPQIVIAPQN